ncbi:MAG TPA: alpha/beta hydrolase-fold protein [Nocardioides sp.]|nr:alpha/beta hydrolase-fold protein [Nocardioides sp.]
MAVTRRSLLLGGAGAAAGVLALGAGLEEGWLPGRTRLRHALGLDGPAGRIPDVTRGPSVSGSFTSAARLGAETGWSVLYPGPPVEPLPVVVALHGLGGDHRTWVDELGVDRFLTAAVAAGLPPFAVATVDGGTTYWHPRPSGEDAGAMVVDELLPLLRRHELDTGRLGFLGYSMGGYGALRLAPIVGARRVRAVGAMSPALWTDPASASRSGFADAAEYQRYSVLGHQADLDGIRVRISCGRDDPFYAADRAYVAGFRQPVTTDDGPGGHDPAYWTRVLPGQLASLGRALGSGA